VVGEPGFLGTRFVGFLPIPGRGDERHSRELRPGFLAAGHLVAVQRWEPDVQEDRFWQETGGNITSLRASAAELAGRVRGHWGVENGLHWCLDVAFREDANRTRDTNAGANLGVARRVAASLLKQDKGKGSIKARRLNAALDTKYLERVLQGFQAD
jgi:hypothetical protein